ncbi:YopX family protein [Enterococcus avium]|uniref:YopX family protein n=1 Tax=Enterococcus avium TaxID=33945 RepID=UPI0032E3F6D6
MIPKFRAWWIQDEVMTHIDTLEFLQGGIRVSDGCWHEKFLGDEVILMQSTGLKDKNGVEIFEGDVVKVSNHPFQKKEDSPGIEIDGNYFINWSEHSLTWLAGDLLLYQLKPYIEVIGNRFENPELLEVEG